MERERDESLATLHPPISEAVLRPYRNDDDEKLLRRYDSALAAQREGQRLAYELEKEIQVRMEDRGATSIPSERFRCELVSDTSYDRTRFTPLKEIFIDGDLAKCWTPATQVLQTVPESWNTAKVKAMAARYGASALDVVEAARVEGRPRLKFEVRG